MDGKKSPGMSIYRRTHTQYAQVHSNRNRPNVLKFKGTGCFKPNVDQLIHFAFDFILFFWRDFAHESINALSQIESSFANHTGVLQIYLNF